jgi:hypothetical protein
MNPIIVEIELQALMSLLDGMIVVAGIIERAHHFRIIGQGERVGVVSNLGFGPPPVGAGQVLKVVVPAD